jgi:hypothetical protein
MNVFTLAWQKVANRSKRSGGAAVDCAYLVGFFYGNQS